MTRMIPPIPHRAITRGEADMFEAIKTAANSDDYICLHSVGIARHQRKSYAEADFVIVGPLGVYCIEVKGGEVKRQNGKWIIGTNKNYEKTESPFEQSRTTCFPLKDHIISTTRLSKSQLMVEWGVAFPHILFDQKSPDWDGDVVYDIRDRTRSFVLYIKRLHEYFSDRWRCSNRQPPPELTWAQIGQIVCSLRGDFEVAQNLKCVLLDSQRDLINLDSEQYAILDLLCERHPRILCDGPAGTGKTLIALEAAKRLIAQNKRLLFLCFNNHLARFLASELTGSKPGTTVKPLFAFIDQLVRAAGLQADYRYAPGETIFARGLELFELAVERLFEDGQLPQYDAIVIDEAQDVLTTPIMNGLDLLLDNGFRSGTWLIFLDSAVQAGVYGRMDRRVLDFIRSLGPAQPTLRRNYRNPKNIVFEVSELLSIERPECRRIFNSNVEYRTFSSEREEGAKLRALVVDLLKSGVEPGSISILSGCATSRCSARRHNVASIARLSYLDEADASPSAGAISVATVSAFKGLENEVVILTDVPALRPLTEWGASVLYVGMTRARSKLFALVDQEFIDARAALSSTHQ